MFTWICPKCGTEVPPSYADCPTCVKVTQAAAPPPPAPAPIAAQPAPAPPPPQQQPAQPAPVAVLPPPHAETLPNPAPPSFGQFNLPEPARPLSFDDAPRSSGLPSWLVALLSLLAVALLGAGVVYFIREQKPTSATETAAPADSTQPIQQAAAPHPLAKFVEVTGLRLWNEGRKPVLKFLVVNHSVGPLGGFDLEIDVHTVNAKPGDPPLMSLKTPVRNIGPMESRDFSVPLTTKLNAIDVPDWQFLRASFRITNAD